VPHQIGREATERKQADLQSSLERARGVAESWFALPPAEQERQRTIWNT
jgi:hypothetical protein